MKIRQFQAPNDSSFTPFKLRFSRPEKAEDNFFSILIGANGTRKSRTLRDIIDLASRMASREALEYGNKAGGLELWGGSLELRSIRKIIALSGVATDRFPSRLTLRGKRDRGDLYSYIGPRTENNLVSRVQSINRVALSLLQASDQIHHRGRAISALLKIIGGFNRIEFTFRANDDLQAKLSTTQLLNRFRKANAEHRGFSWDEREAGPLLPKSSRL
ncbi:hypothetical protein X551_03796 [Methylibium sp. T29]|nr:hypothetical protein X551_03796 [Methylibium sp. T29]EWS58903.1 hypothetical protein Y694_03236 [Methylibium sp. T29-B]